MAKRRSVEDVHCGLPARASGTFPLSINRVLGEDSSATGNLVWPFVKMAPYDYIFLRSRRLTVENNQDLAGRHDALCMIPHTKGLGLVSP